MFLFHILTREKKELIYKVYRIQECIRTKNDWFGMMLKEKIKYNIELSDEDISQMSKNQFKKYVDLRVNKVTFESLISSDKSKLQDIIKCTKQAKDGKSKPQLYLNSTRLSTFEKQTIFEIRCRNFNCKSNTKSFYVDNMSCRVCLDPNSYEDENHTFTECKSLLEDRTPVINYQDVYGTLLQQISFIKDVMPIIRKRNIFLQLSNSE